MPHDRMGRRSRFKRTETGKHIFLTDRDTDILRLLYRYRYLRATHLVAFLKPKSEKRLIERLGNLYHEVGLIDRPSAQWRRFDARYAPMIYELSPKGLRHLETYGQLPDRAVTFARKYRNGVFPQFDHAMMIVDALTAVELGTTEKPEQRFVPVDEILRRAPEKTRKAKRPLAIPVTIPPNKELNITTPLKTYVVPDALYGVEYLIDGEKGYRFYALECENRSPKRRATAKLSSLALKEAAYETLARSRGFYQIWGIPNLAMTPVSRN